MPTPRDPATAAPGRPPQEGWLRRWLAGLRLRLFVLVLLAILPALFLVVYTAIQTRETAKEEAIKVGQRLVGLAAANQKQHIEATRQLLQTLAQLKEVRPTEAAACQALLTNLLAVHPVYVNIVAIAPDGRAFARAVPEIEGDPVDYTTQGWFREARDQRKFVVSEYRVHPHSQRAIMDLAQPVRDNESGQLVAIMAVTIDLGWVAGMAGKLDLVDGSTLTVVDRTGVVLVRYSVPDSRQNWVGSQIPGADRMIARTRHSR